MAESHDTNPEDFNEGVPPEFVVLAMEKVSGRFQFCDLENPVVQSIHQMSLIREAKNLMEGDSSAW